MIELFQKSTWLEPTKKLFNQPQIGLNTFYRGFNDGTKFKYKIIYTSKLFDLLKAYSIHLNKNDSTHLKIEVSQLYTVEAAIERLKNIFGNTNDWMQITDLIPNLSKNLLINKSAISSTFVASLGFGKSAISGGITNGFFFSIKNSSDLSDLFVPNPEHEETIKKNNMNIKSLFFIFFSKYFMEY